MFGPFTDLLRRLTGGPRRRNTRRVLTSQRRPPEIQEDPATRFIRTVQRMKQANPGFRDHLYIISMADFRAAVGEKWLRLASKVANLGENVVGRHVGRDGLFCQADDQTFIITLPKDTREKARGRMVLIAQDLSTYLIGDQVINGQRPMILAANIPFDKAVNQQGRFDVQALGEAVEESRSVAIVADEKVAASQDAAPTLASLEVFRVGEPPRASKAAAILGVDVDDEGAANPGEEGWNALKHAKRTGQTAEWQRIRARAAGGTTFFPWDDAGPLTAATRISVVWRPTWMARSEAVGAYSARVLRFEGPDKPPSEGSHAYPQRSAMDGLNIDRVVIAQTVRQLQSGSSQSKAAVIIAPLCWMSVTTDHRRALLGPLGDVPKSVLRERLVVEVINLPDVPDRAQLTDMLAFMAHIGVNVMLRVRMVNALRVINAQLENALSIDLSELSPDERIGDAALLARIAELRVMAAQNGGGFAIWGIRRRNVIAASVKAGFSMLSGPGLMGDVNGVKAVIPLAHQTLIESLPNHPQGQSTVAAPAPKRMSAAHA
jgi:hypothetical protein